MIAAAGVSGELWAGYQKAAQLGAWTLQRGTDAVYLVARIESCHAIWSEWRPLRLVLFLGGSAWIWDRLHPQLGGEEFRLTLNEPPRTEVLASPLRV